MRIHLKVHGKISTKQKQDKQNFNMKVGTEKSRTNETDLKSNHSSTSGGGNNMPCTESDGQLEKVLCSS
jgi:hypothetical protein